MTWPSVSVIIPSYNQGRYIERTLLSILRQGYPGPLQVIVSDGGSTDETVEVLRRYPQVLWWSERDGGFADAVTKGLAAATGEVVAIQSSDDYYLRGALARAAAALRDEPGIDFVTGNELRVLEEGQFVQPPLLPYVTLMNPGGLIGRTPVFNVPQHCTFARRRAIDRVGGLREAVDRCADFDLWYRLLHFGRALVLPDYLGVCQVHAGQRTQSSADLWIASLEKVVEDAERDPAYASRFVPTPQMKRHIFRQWEILWSIAAGDARVGYSLARQVLERPEEWPDYVFAFVKEYGSEPPHPEASRDTLDLFETSVAIASVGKSPQNLQARQNVLREIRQSPMLRGLLGKPPAAHQDQAASRKAVGLGWGTRPNAPPIVIGGTLTTQAIDVEWWMGPMNTQYTQPERSLSRENNQMLEAEKEKRIDEWNRYIHDRVAGPLRPDGFLIPERLQSVLIIVPGSSGDVVLATTLVRYIKERNPLCHVSFSVKKSNLPLIQLCPGVDEVVEWPRETKANPRGRRRGLTKYADRADAVVYPICDPEDMDLLLRYNFLETIWLLAGVPDGMPPGPLMLWMISPSDTEGAIQVLKRCISHKSASYMIGEAGRQPVTLFKTALRQRKFKNLGWKTAPVASVNLLRNARFVRKLADRFDLQDAAKEFVIISNEANMFPPPAKGIFEEIVRFFRQRGRIVLQNVLDPANALPGAVPLICSYHDFLRLRGLGIPFVGWRSGLCDIAAVSKSPMCVIYPSTFAGCGPLIQANMEHPIESFGFAAMNIAADCAELVCDSVTDLDLQKLGSLLV